MISVTAINSPACQLAEGPLWHAQRAELYWVDIEVGKLYSYNPATGICADIYSGERVGGFTFNSDGTLVLFRVRDVCWIDFDGKVLGAQSISLEGMRRFNDVIAAPGGSVFAGTIGTTKESGGLYHFRPEGTVRRLFSGTGCANGMGFSPDRTVFYWTCSTSRKIFAYDFKDGEVDVPSSRVFYAAPEEEKTPDGMTVDFEGNIWSARWDGFRLVKISPAGKKLEEVSIPRGRVSSAIFGGTALDRLYVTAAADQGKITPCLYELKGEGLRGREEFYSQLDAGKTLKEIE